MTGYTTINAKDIWTEYGAFLAETSPDAHVNMDALMRMPKAKDITTVDFRERNGVELPDNPDIKLASISRTLQFWIGSEYKGDRLDKYQKFLSLISSGKLTVEVKGYRTYRLVYQDMPADPGWYDSCDGNRFGVLFTVRFLDYAPAV